MSNMDNATFLKGLGVGVLMGSAISVAMKTGKSDNKNAWGKTIKSMGEVVENVSSVLGIQ
ncbi:MAG: hypothetical protein ACOX81_03240 [Candidatus Heteroscillospira sp.]|jgi:gas vesicle protein